MHTGDLFLTGARTVTPEGVRTDTSVHVSEGRIHEVRTGAAAPGATTVDLSGCWLVPGFVDVHCHGGGGGSFTSTDPQQLRTALSTHRKHGTTTMLASLVSAPMSDLTTQLATLRELVAADELAGVHLEGPFLAEARCGAHDPEILADPRPELLNRLLATGDGTIRMITLAPERTGAVAATRHLVEHGVTVALGHTDAVAEQVLPAVDAGATVATHLFNGMRPLHHREPGPVGALLNDERVTVELICDLVHVHPAVLRLAATHAGTHRTVAVTDAISATAAGDGTYELGNLPVTVTRGEPRLSDGSLAGSTLTMDRAFRNLVQHAGLSIPDAVAATATHPAQLLGMQDEVGSITPGSRADLVVLDENLALRSVLRGGSWIDG